MLVLTRDEGESILIETEAGERIAVMLVKSVGGFRARIGVQASSRTTIIARTELRPEVTDAIAWARGGPPANKGEEVR